MPKAELIVVAAHGLGEGDQAGDRTGGVATAVTGGASGTAKASSVPGVGAGQRRGGHGQTATAAKAAA
jgi:hypothetical protein